MVTQVSGTVTLDATLLVSGTEERVAIVRRVTELGGTAQTETESGQSAPAHTVTIKVVLPLVVDNIDPLDALADLWEKITGPAADE
jgi:hypothetical protein